MGDQGVSLSSLLYLLNRLRIRIPPLGTPPLCSVPGPLLPLHLTPVPFFALCLSATVVSHVLPPLTPALLPPLAPVASVCLPFYLSRTANS